MAGTLAAGAAACPCAAPAVANTTVAEIGAAQTTLAVHATPGGRDAMVTGPFADDRRHGLAVSQLSTGDPPISSTDPSCTAGPLFNDVVCDVAVLLPVRTITVDTPRRRRGARSGWRSSPGSSGRAWCSPRRGSSRSAPC